MKKYRVRTISREEEIISCDRADINEASWTCLRKPKAWARMGYLRDQGLLIRMECLEQDPKRQYTKHGEPVWRDSAMEVFLAFPLTAGNIRGELTNDSLYLNFEINANGAMYAQYGYGKQARRFVPENVYRESGCHSLIGEDGWMTELLVPEWFLRETCRWEEGPFYCNFYKISESPEMEHYLSYSPVVSGTPDFHLPVCFAEAVRSEN